MFKKFLVFLFTINVISNVTYAEKIEVFKFNEEELQTLKVRKKKNLLITLLDPMKTVTI